MVSKPSRILFNAEFPTSLSKALIENHCCGRSMAGFGNIRKGRREAVDNLAFTEGGDCPRCGGESQPSTMNGYHALKSSTFEGIPRFAFAGLPMSDWSNTLLIKMTDDYRHFEWKLEQ